MMTSEARLERFPRGRLGKSCLAGAAAMCFAALFCSVTDVGARVIPIRADSNSISRAAGSASAGDVLVLTTSSITHESNQVVLSDVSGDPGPSIFVLPGLGLIVFGVVVFLVRRREVAKRKRMTAQLRSTQERLQHLLDTSPAVIYSCEPDKDMALTFISENVKQLLGYQPEEVLADPKFWRGNIHMEDLPRVMGELPGILVKNQHAHNYRVLAKSGEYRWIHDQARLVKDGNGAPTEIVGSLIDITQRVESDEARRSAERNLEAQRALSIRSDRLRSFGEMAAGIAHELNQPLTGVRGLAEHTLISLENGWDDSKEKLRHRTQGIVDQADRMVHIIDHIRMFAREAGKPDLSSVNANDVVRASTDMLRAQLQSHGVALQTELKENLPKVLANPFSLEEVILNLLSNARDAVAGSHGSSWVRIRTDALLDGCESRVIIEVSDNGKGIAEGNLSKIWDPFFTTKDPDKGTGLGLSISKSIVEDFGGSVDVESTEGQGTKITIALPVAKTGTPS